MRLARVPESTLTRLSAKHGFAPAHAGIRWFGGSNDLSSLDVGATYTEFELGGDGDVLAGLRSGVTRPKGEMGSTAKTARTVIGLAASGLGLLSGQPNAPYWLVAVIIGLLMSAARSSWDLLVKVGEERRTANAAG